MAPAALAERGCVGVHGQHGTSSGDAPCPARSVVVDTQVPSHRPSRMRRFTLLSILVLAPSSAFAQGIPDVRSNIALPNAQGAAVEDATALLVNPAGLALIEGTELSVGAFGRNVDAVGSRDVDAMFAARVTDGLGLGIGGGLAFPAPDDVRGRTGGGAAGAFAGTPVWRTSLGLGVGDRSFTAGLALHALSAMGRSEATQWSADAGAQLRPARWLGLGIGLERIGAGNDTPVSGRMGVSVRPFAERITVGIDARIVPGRTDLESEAFTNGLTLAPAVVGRAEFDGFALAAGATWSNLGPGAQGPPALDLMTSLEVNSAKFGATLLGGASQSGTGGDDTRIAAGARVRASSAAWPTLFHPRERWLALALEGEGTLAEKHDRGFIAELFAQEPDAETVLLALQDAAGDPTVSGVFIDLRGLSLGWGRLAEIRAALAGIRAAGKRVVVHMDAGDDGDVFVASVADRVFLTPSGDLEFNGLRAERIYLGDALRKLGITAEAVAAGRYKSAPRQFTADGPSPEELEVEAALLDGAFAALTTLVAEGRGLTTEAVRALIDRGGMSASEAVEHKLVDGLAYTDEMKERIEEFAGGPIQLDTRFMSRTMRNIRWDAPPRLALIPVRGTIAMRGGFSLLGGDTASAEDVVAAIHSAADDDAIRAIVLRIDSPGGDALASDLMWRAVMKAREKKPVVASMGDVAASGGYYVAAAADAIWAEANAITGSIGVFGLFANIEELADRTGIRTHRSDRGAITGPSTFEPLTAPQRAALQRSVDAAYTRFLQAVIAGRGQASGLDEASLRAVAEGRVWNGAQARERKLVDDLGGLADAVADARRRAGIPDDESITIEVVSGGGGGLDRLTGMVRTLQALNLTSVQALARLVMGDPSAAEALVNVDGRPLALAHIVLRHDVVAR